MDYQIFTRTPKVQPILIFMYELEMLNATHYLYDVRDQKHRKGAILESFLLHARNLVEFFEGKPKYEDDLTCRDFQDLNGVPIEGISLGFPNDFMKLLHKHLAHMSKVRLDDKPGWGMKEIRHKINEHAIFFIEQCAISNFPANSTKEDYLRQLKEWRKRQPNSQLMKCAELLLSEVVSVYQKSI